jgi:hypothetical protein
MSKNVKFEDKGMRLLVVDHLMYSLGLINPKLNAHDFVKNFNGRDIDLDEEGYDPIPEIVDYIDQIQIRQEWLSQITELTQNANDIYMQIVPLDDISDTNMWGDILIKNTKDIGLLPNLKKVTLYEGEVGRDWLLEEFVSRGVQAEWL